MLSSKTAHCRNENVKIVWGSDENGMEMWHFLGGFIAEPVRGKDIEVVQTYHEKGRTECHEDSSKLTEGERNCGRSPLT